MDQKKFECLIAEIERGAEIVSDELQDTLLYACSAWYEIRQLTAKLCAGYRALQIANKKSEDKLKMANTLLAAAMKENKALRKSLGGETD